MVGRSTFVLTNNVDELLNLAAAAADCLNAMCVCQCERAARIQKQMQTLWRNRVPMCIEVLLFANCRHGQLRCNTTDIAPPDASDSCILLEQWTIQNVARK